MYLSLRIRKLVANACADPTLFFLVDEELEVSNTTKSGPSLSCQRNTIQMVFRWLADGGPTLNAGL